MMAGSWRSLLARLWHEDEGMLTFEYVMLNTLLVLGTVGAMSGVRDTVNGELNGLNQSMQSLDQMRPANLSEVCRSQTSSAAGHRPVESRRRAGSLIDIGGGGVTASSATALSTTASNATATVTTSSGVQF